MAIYIYINTQIKILSLFPIINEYIMFFILNCFKCSNYVQKIKIKEIKN